MRQLSRILLIGCAALGGGGGALAQPFTFLQPGFTQEVFGNDAAFMGGVAFAPDGDVWISPCAFGGGSLRRFDLQTTTAPCSTTLIHPLIATVGSSAGCGLTNHPDGFLYSNTSGGVTRQDASTGLPAGGGFGPGGNALGIAPWVVTDELVYVGADGTLFAVDNAFTASRTFSLVLQNEFIDGIFFDPSATFLFTATRTGGFRVSIIRASDGSLVQHVALPSEPDGIAFHASAPRFVVTNNTDGTMSRLDFPGDDFTLPPVVTLFASGGFRGDLSQVGPDGCLYITQDGTRCSDGTQIGGDSVVRICGGFAPPPGACAGTIGFDETVGGVEIPAGTVIDTEYTSLGVLVSGQSFDSGVLGAFTNRRGAPGTDTNDLIPTSRENFLTTSARNPFDPTQSDFGRIRFDFVDPQTGAPRTVDFASVQFLDVEDSGSGGSGNSILRGVRCDGSFVEVVVPSAGDGDAQLVSVGALGGGDAFCAVEADIGDASDSAAIDDLCFHLNAAGLELGCDGGPEVVAPGDSLHVHVGVRNNQSVRAPVTLSIGVGLQAQPPRSIVFSRTGNVPPHFDNMQTQERREFLIPIPAQVPSRLIGRPLQVGIRATHPTEGWDYARHTIDFVISP